MLTTELKQFSVGNVSDCNKSMQLSNVLSCIDKTWYGRFALPDSRASLCQPDLEGRLSV